MSAIFDLHGWKHAEFNGLNYHYVHVKPTQPSKPTIVCFHGVPTALMAFRKIIPMILSSGYGAVLIELPGFGETDKPSNLAQYSRVMMARSAAGILDAEGLDQVVVLAHDFGTFVGAAFSLLFPERVLGLILVALPFFEPNGEPFDARTHNAHYIKTVGYEPFAYMEWFVSDEEVHKMISDHLEALVTAWFADDMGREMCARGVLKAKLLADTKTSGPTWASQEDIDETIAFLARNDMNAMLNWYRFLITYPDENELTLPKRLAVPYLWLQCTNDPVVPPGHDGGQAERCDDLTTRSFAAGHFLMEEDTDGAWGAIEEFLVAKGVISTQSDRRAQDGKYQSRWLWDSSTMRWLRQRTSSEK